MFETCRAIALLTLLVFVEASCQGHTAKQPRSSEDFDEEEAFGSTFIVINIPAREMTLFNKGKIVYRFPVAVGSAVYKTPIGSRALGEIIWNPWWLPPNSPWAAGSSPTPPGPGNPLGAVKMDLGGAILLHGTNKEYTVGTPASHGCMRMYNADAKTLAWWIQSRVTDKDDEELLETYAAHRSTSYHVRLENPVPVEIEYEIFGLENALLRSHPDIYGREGNRKEKLLTLFSDMGYSEEQVDSAAVDNLLEKSARGNVELPLREIIPGKWNASRHKISDPVDESWKLKRSKSAKKTGHPFSWFASLIPYRPSSEI